MRDETRRRGAKEKDERPVKNPVNPETDPPTYLQDPKTKKSQPLVNHEGKGEERMLTQRK